VKATAQFVVVLALLVGGEGCTTVGESKTFPHADREIRAVLEQQARDWNAGNVAAFMRGYAKSDSTRFASGADVIHGWQTVLDRYVKKYPDRAAMGTLTFSDLDIAMLSPDAAVVLGRWRLKRAQDEPNGVFTLIFRKTADGWRIVHDHTSSASAN
jgi:ketosteroid isomerase-like protein